MVRLSMGGQVVADSFAAVGFTHKPPGVAMVETVTPHRRYRCVLVQSAWNVIPRSDFLELIEPYPSKMKRRAVARRAVAHINIRRADTVLCFTQAAADLVRNNLGVEARVAPVSLPMHDLHAPAVPTICSDIDGGQPFALVPGSVTWYKRPESAVNVVAQAEPGLRHILYCGSDDGSGAWERVRSDANQAGIRVTRRRVSRAELYTLYKRAQAIVLPSALETLGFALSEAMYFGSGTVHASAIPAHVEIAERVGGTSPKWIGLAGESVAETCAVVTVDSIRMQWVAAGQALGLAS
jgi:glycosyltransferase involved in cell wall biosynthesis